ncbi:unknown [Brachyspira sp. CAG:700]|nr:unknown [Brachyspira sp. CAG:700]
MKGQKKFYLLLIILSLIALFSISCNNDNNNKDKTGAEEVEKDKTGAEQINKDKTGTEKINKDKTEKEEVKKERKLSYYAGNWWTSSTNESGINIITINTDDSITFKDGTNPDVKIPSNSITRVSDTNYTTIYNDSSVNIDVKLTLIFSSDTQGKLTMETETETETDPAIVDITKK